MGTVQAKEAPRNPIDMSGIKNRRSENTPKVDGKRNAPSKSQPSYPASKFKTVRARVDKVNIEGLGRTKDDIIIESIQPLFSAGDFIEVLKQAHEIRERLVSLGCFNNVRIYIDTSSGKTATPDGLEVTFHVSEMRRLTGAINTLFGSNNEGSVALSMRLPNLMGRGERIQAECSYGNRRTSNYNFGFVKPLRGRANAFFTTSVFQHFTEQPASGYKEIDRGLLFDLAFTSAPLVRHNLQWETTWRDLSVLNRTTAFEIREMSGPSLKGSLRHILSVDRRDQPIFPRSGTLWRITTEYAGIGGNVNFLKNEAQFQANIPLSNDVVFQATLHGGLLKSIGNTKPPSLCDHFFLGGPLSLRGFESRGVGPQAGRNALGASTYWAGGLHLYSPLPFIRPGGFGDLFRAHLFLNAGNIGNFEFTDDYNHNLEVLGQNMRLAYGLGIAMKLGDIARVELNYCLPHLHQRTDAINKGLQFGIGFDFL
ncbi:Sorting and assembly machinery component 50-like protein [Frankliniella fusca]|uniref:Sorting and assembly machinery component 50-like protein n=1 Tax=Frankliniella fusca TaxID=407009 RepID=A0AAE1HF67_9NEOP|nr:Sorting and assembly machinery component 50-like protein [Frankliniella fusca]